KSPHTLIEKQKTYAQTDVKESCLVFSKQDAHLNKFDIEGNNNIDNRFFNIEYKLERMLKKAQISSNLNKVVYIIGSDEFNSEFTNATTGGTPQDNLLPYHEGFMKICQNELYFINILLTNYV